MSPFEAGYQAGVARERNRIRAILECREAQGRRPWAVMLATETELPPEEALHLLAAMPFEPAASALPRKPS